MTRYVVVDLHRRRSVVSLAVRVGESSTGYDDVVAPSVGVNIDYAVAFESTVAGCIVDVDQEILGT